LNLWKLPPVRPSVQINECEDCTVGSFLLITWQHSTGVAPQCQQLLSTANSATVCLVVMEKVSATVATAKSLPVGLFRRRLRPEEEDRDSSWRKAKTGLQGKYGYRVCRSCDRSWSRGLIKELVNAVHCFEGKGLVESCTNERLGLRANFLVLKG
jgi:hypothetical protein